MEGLAPECCERRLGLWTQMNCLGLEVRPVDGVAEQGVTGMGVMEPDLVGAPGLQPQGEQGGDRLAVAPVKGGAGLPMCDRLAAALAHRHLLPRVRVAIDRRDDGAVRPVRDAPGEGEIAALHRTGAAM